VTTTDTSPTAVQGVTRGARTGALAAAVAWLLGTALQVTGELLFPQEEGVATSNAVAVVVFATGMLALGLGVVVWGRRRPFPAAVTACVLAALTLVLVYYTPGAAIFGAVAWFLGRDLGRGGRTAGIVGGLAGLAWFVSSIAWWVNAFIG
jgi:hypothetical protein